MNCKNCGAPLNEKDAFCKSCGSLVGFDNQPTVEVNNVPPIPGAIDFSNGSQTAATNPVVEEPKQDAPVVMPDVFSTMPNSTPSVEQQPVEPVAMPNLKPEEIQQPVVQSTNVAKEEVPTVEPIHVEQPTTPNVQPITPSVPEVQPTVPQQPVEVAPQVPSLEPQVAPAEVEFAPEEKELEIDEVKRSKKGLIIGIVIVVILLALGGFFLFQYLKDKKIESEVDKQNVGNVDQYRINFKGFRLDIPENYIYLVSGDKLYISDSQNTWYSAIQIDEQDYTSVKGKANSIVQAYQKSGFKISNSEEKNIGKRKFYALELQSGSKYALVGYTKADANHVFALTAYNPTYTIDYAILENISSILDSVVYVGEPGTINQSSTVDIIKPIN